MSGKPKRRKRSSSEKLRIVLSGLDGTIEISELCRREGINLLRNSTSTQVGAV